MLVGGVREFYSFRRSREFLGFYDYLRRSREVGQNGAGDGAGDGSTFGRWDEYGWRTVACGTRAESWARSRKVGGVRWIGMCGGGWLDGC